MKKYEKKFAQLPNGEKLAYLEEGSGSKTILLVHGNMSSSVHWTPLIEQLESSYKVIAVDMRGFGDSSYNQRFDHLDALTDDIAQFCKVKGLGKMAVAGWSTGGGVVMTLAAKYPEYVEKLILVDAMSYHGYPIFRKDALGKPQFGLIYESKEAMGNDPIQVAPAVKCIEEKNFAFMTYLWNLSIYTAGKKPTDEDNAILINETFKQRNLVDIDWSLCTYNISNQQGFYSMGNGLIDKIDVPVISFWGEKDITVPLFMAKDNETGFKKIKLVVISNSGHSPINDAVEELAAGIKVFY